MRSLTTHEIHSISGGSVDIFDLGYLFAGYNHLDMGYTVLAGTGLGLGAGLLNYLFPIAGAAPVAGFLSSAMIIAAPAGVGACLAFLEYQIGSYCSSWVNQA